MKTRQMFVRMVVGIALFMGIPCALGQAAAEAPGVEEQFQKMGVDARTVGHIRGAFKNAGVQEDKIDVALAGVVKTIMEMKEKGGAFQMDQELVNHLKTEGGLNDQQVQMVRGLAGRVKGMLDGRGRGQQQQQKRDGKMFTEDVTMVYVQTLIQAFDKDKNIIVDEGELEKGFLGLLEQSEANHAKLLVLFDEDKNGALGKEEQKAARTFFFQLASTVLYDADRDWKVGEKESEKAWDGLSDQYERHNENMVKKFDGNKDGELDPEETKKAQRAMQQWQKQQQGRRKRGQPGQRDGRQPAQKGRKRD